jgi:fibronectin type 3 domain-containing protein
MLNMKTSFGYVICFSLMLLSPMIQAQHKYDQPITSAVKVIANPKDNRITLRWAPTTSLAWVYGNQFGYTIQRITLVRSNTPLKAKEKIILSSYISPQPLAAWETEIRQNKYAAVAAQALYGKTFQINQPGGGGMMEMVNQAKESDQRFSFALFAADYSPVVAAMSGLGFVDDRVNYEEHYLYKVWVNMPDNRYPIDTGYVYTGLKEFRDLPAPPKPDVRFLDRQAVISWNYAYHNSTYIAYFIERSTDGRNFKSISSDPVVPAENTPKPTGIINVIDTLQDNNTTYTYRIKGISAFGETGPVSQSAEGRGKKSLSAAPAIRTVTVIGDSVIRVQWEYPSAVIDELSGFQIERSFAPKGPFKPISPVLLPASDEFIDSRPGVSNYYRVVAMNADDRTYSFPHLAQLQDTIPPALPTGVTGMADTLGVVFLQWNPNKETDLLGYRVYRANFDTHEYGQITVSPVSAPAFTDTINLKTLTRNVYYKIVAIDRHFNPSAFSEAVTVHRPDVLPPAAPSFHHIAYQPGNGIIVRWIRSASTDIRNYLIYRRTTLDQSWRLLTLLSDTASQFIDTQVQNKNMYEYSLVASDQSGLQSIPCAPVRITINDHSNKPIIEKFSAKVDTDNKQILLSWTYDAPEVQQFLIYRHGVDGRMRLYESVPSGILQFSDSHLTVNTHYQYSIKAVFRDGAHSPFSKVIKVLY